VTRRHDQTSDFLTTHASLAAFDPPRSTNSSQPLKTFTKRLPLPGWFWGYDTRTENTTRQDQKKNVSIQQVVWCQCQDYIGLRLQRCRQLLLEVRGICAKRMTRLSAQVRISMITSDPKFRFHRVTTPPITARHYSSGRCSPWVATVCLNLIRRHPDHR
jgi:hypothetical protein